MTGPTKPPDSTPGGGRDESIDRDDGMKRLLRSALADETAPDVDVLRGVQRRLRERSGGKFYSDRWVTSRQPPIATYLVTSLLMLAVVCFIYLVLTPLRGAAKAIDAQPAPVQIIAPAPRR